MSEATIRSIDTNILLRHLHQDHDDHSTKASALLLDVRRGQRTIYCPATVIFEAIHILHDRVGLPRNDVAWALQNLIELPTFVMSEDRVIVDALDFWTKQSPLDYADCYHLALMKALGMTEICTFDQKMDRFPGVERVEP